MVYDFLSLTRQGEVPLYLQLYENMKQAIENGSMPGGERMPSIRKLSQDLHLSRTTIEAAYQQLLVEGYIKSRPQSGYYVMEEIKGTHWQSSPTQIFQKEQITPKSVRYDLGTDRIDSEHVDIKLWRKHIKDILGQEEQLSSYGDHQGEPALREALSAYSHGVRGVAVTPQNIVIGAGTQPLLYLLCGLIQGRRRVAMELTGFRQAEQVFADCGLQIAKLPFDKDGILLEALEASQADLLWVSPSSRIGEGGIPMNRRLRLLEWSKRTGGMIIEDDYNGELRYNARPIPAMQSLAPESVVFMGSFSKLLLPSVRIGYMILPGSLLPKYGQRAHHYNQTASKVEQLALARYIREGQMERQLRRLRKLYASKSTILIEQLEKVFGESVKVQLRETSLCLLVTVNNGMDAQQLVEAARANEVRVIQAEKTVDGFHNQVLLGFAGISLQDIIPAVGQLKKAWSG